MKVPNSTILTLMATTTMFSPTAHAHRCRHRNHNGWNSCDLGSCGQIARCRNHRSSRIDLLSDIFSVPIYMNTLLCTHKEQLDRMECSNL